MVIGLSTASCVPVCFTFFFSAEFGSSSLNDGSVLSKPTQPWSWVMDSAAESCPAPRSLWSGSQHGITEQTSGFSQRAAQGRRHKGVCSHGYVCVCVWGGTVPCVLELFRNVATVGHVFILYVRIKCLKLVCGILCAEGGKTGCLSTSHQHNFPQISTDRH